MYQKLGVQNQLNCLHHLLFLNGLNMYTYKWSVWQQVSYLEIYCERVRDLLSPSAKNNLRVR